MVGDRAYAKNQFNPRHQGGVVTRISVQFVIYLVILNKRVWDQIGIARRAVAGTQNDRIWWTLCAFSNGDHIVVPHVITWIMTSRRIVDTYPITKHHWLTLSLYMMSDRPVLLTAFCERGPHPKQHLVA